MTKNAGALRRPWLHLAVLAVSLVLITGEARPAEASFPGDNGRIAFSSATTGSSGSSQWTLNSVRADGTGRQSLGPGTGTGSFSPAYSANGKKVAYTYSRGEFGDDIYTANADGSRARNLTSRTSHPYRATQPAWSPNGSQILFVDDQSWYGDILVMNADGSGVRRLTNVNNASAPAWSPDGRTIAFVRSTFVGAPTFVAGQIWVMNADGSGQRSLGAAGFGPDWSPDATLLVFSSNRTGDDEIWLMNADGSGQRQLAARAAFSDTNPAWSPDGSMIVFASARLGAGTATKSALWLMSSAGSGQRQLTASNVYDTEPSWQPLSG